jgi:hypothetical protein
MMKYKQDERENMTIIKEALVAGMGRQIAEFFDSCLMISICKDCWTA